MIESTYTVESVTSGHPDKVCDQISDAILDECLRQDPKSRVAVETFGSHGLLVIGGEITTRAHIDAPHIARNAYHAIGYREPLKIISHIAQQSPDIAQGVDTGGAGDQGIMYGFATDETPELLPKQIVQVHKLAQGLELLRRTDPECTWLGPDGKTQITVQDGRATAILVSCQHAPQIAQDKIKKHITEKLIAPIVGDTSQIKIFVNPTGSFIRGGFEADAGLTGRKIMVDTYCGLIPHGGGAFSGKDASKVDRSAAYMARFAAKNIVSNGYAKQCLVSVAYAIGRAEPLMLHARDEHGKNLDALVQKHFDFRPRAIIERLGLERPLFHKTASYGHFGKIDLPWEHSVRL